MGHDLSNADPLAEVFLYYVGAVVSYQWNYYATLLCALKVSVILKAITGV